MNNGEISLVFHSTDTIEYWNTNTSYFSSTINGSKFTIHRMGTNCTVYYTILWF